MRTPRNDWRMRLAILAAVLAAAFFVVFGARGARAAVQPASAPSASGHAQGAPAMWIVRDRDTTIYLFGTFHIIDARTSWFQGAVKEAFDRSDELVLEADLPSDPDVLEQRLGPIVERYAVDPQGRTISSRLTAGQQATLDAALASIGIAGAATTAWNPGSST